MDQKILELLSDGVIMADVPFYSDQLQKSGRRAGPRFQVSNLNVSVAYRDAKSCIHRISGTVKDVASRGLCCVLDKAVPEGVVALVAKIDSGSRAFEVDCAIRWRSDETNNYGVSFNLPQPAWWEMVMDMQQVQSWSESFDRRRAWRNKAKKALR